MWLTLRGTRHKHLCGVCLKPGDTFPGRFYTEAMCEHCIATYGITPIQHCPYGVQLQEALCASYSIPPTRPERAMVSPETLMAPFRNTFPANGTVCAACGCGDNTIGHWSRLVNISLQNGQAGDRLGVIAVDGIHSAVFREMSYAPSERRKNVSLEYLHCQCG